MNMVASVAFLFMMATVLLCAFWDRRKKRTRAVATPVSVVVPCYNDAATVADCLRSVFASHPADLLDVTVVNDRSTDDSRARIAEVAREFPVRVVDNPVNMGKSATLNAALPSARHELVLCLDADTMLNPDALGDMLARFGHDSRVGAVSCPYAPSNRGFLPSMQAMEYNMLRLSQGAGNVTSVMALWGGCLMVRREDFRAVGGFSSNAITEDVDLAFKLNREGRRVEQSFVFVRSLVPDTWRGWARQKLRWTAGGFQCVFKYPLVWLRNPLQTLFITSYALLTVAGLCGLMADTSLINIGRDLFSMWAMDIPSRQLWHTMGHLYGPILAAKMVVGAVMSLFSLAYVLPTISRVQDWVRIALVIPFSMGYFPLYIIVSILGFGFWFIALSRMPVEERAW